MNNILILGKVLLKDYFTKTFFGGDDKTNLKKYGSIALLVVILLPTYVNFVNLSKETVLQLMELNQSGLFIALVINALSVFILFSSFFIIPSVLYFSKDLENLLPLPFKPYEIITAKLSVAFIYEYLIIIILSSPFWLGYFLAVEPAFGFYILLFMIMLVLPFVPVLVVGILEMVIMAFSNIFKNQDRFNFFSTIVSLAFMLVYFITIQNLSVETNKTIDVISLLIQGNNSLAHTFVKAVPTVPLLIKTLLNGDLIAYAIALAITAGVIIIFFLAADKLYFKGVLRISNSASKKIALSSKQLSSKTKVSGIYFSYMKKDFLLLIRSPIYLMQCIIAPMIMPVFMLIPIFSSGKEGLNNLMSYFSTLSINSQTLFYSALAGIALALMISFTSTISITAISREGKNFGFMRQIPIPFFTQVQAKSFVGLALNNVFSIIFVLLLTIIFSINPILSLVTLGFTFIVNTALSYLALTIDLNRPRLNWSDEITVVKQNMNIFIFLLIVLGFLAVFGFMLPLLFTVTSNDLINLIILLVITLTLMISLYLIAKKTANKFKDPEVN